MQLKKLYEDCIKTAPLWFGDSIESLKQIQLSNEIYSYDLAFKNNLRLGKLVERFICFQLEQDNSIQLLVENYQVQNNKLSIGEIDCIFLKNGIPIHLEIIYKFYLYDPNIGNHELEHWVGPNRSDTLVKKLDKLKSKQLPLLYNKHTKPLLNTLNIKEEDIQQKVCFKAQLFVPLTSKQIRHTLINPKCINGFYLSRKALFDYTNSKFFMPTKLEWLGVPHNGIQWQSYNTIQNDVDNLLEDKKSPLLWIKTRDERILKCFIVWW